MTEVAIEPFSFAMHCLPACLPCLLSAHNSCLSNGPFLCIFCIPAVAQESFKCPDDFGFYPHHSSCDKYWKCDNNAAELKTCGNGLAFDASDSKYLTENCDYIHNVDCAERTQLGTYDE